MIAEALTLFITLFVIVDPIGTVPVFLSLTHHYSEEQRIRMAKKAVLISAGVLIFFIILGQILFDAIGIRLLSFELAGGVVLFLFGLKMIFDKPEGTGMKAEANHDPAIFPLAIPTIAGPGAMLGVVVAANHPNQNTNQQIVTTFVLLLVLIITYILLRLANPIQKIIGTTGAIILSRIMGILLTAIATETILRALTKFSNL